MLGFYGHVDKSKMLGFVVLIALNKKRWYTAQREFTSASVGIGWAEENVLQVSKVISGPSQRVKSSILVPEIWSRN